MEVGVEVGQWRWQWQPVTCQRRGMPHHECGSHAGAWRITMVPSVRRKAVTAHGWATPHKISTIPPPSAAHAASSGYCGGRFTATLEMAGTGGLRAARGSGGTTGEEGGTASAAGAAASTAAGASAAAAAVRNAEPLRELRAGSASGGSRLKMICDGLSAAPSCSPSSSASSCSRALRSARPERLHWLDAEAARAPAQHPAHRHPIRGTEDATPERALGAPTVSPVCVHVTCGSARLPRFARRGRSGYLEGP